MVYHNFKCEVCSDIFEEFSTFDEAHCITRPVPCPKAECSGQGNRVFLPRQYSHSIHESERAVVYEHPSGDPSKVVVLPDSRLPLPERYRRQGYSKTEFNSLRDLERFEKRTGLVNEKAWFDNGSGTKRLDE